MSSYFSVLSSFFIFFSFSLSGVVFAQSSTDADRIQQQRDQILRQQQQRLEAERKRLENSRENTIIQTPKLSAPSSTSPDSDLCFDITAIVIEGVESIDEHKIDATKKEYVNRCLSLQDINTLLKTITAVYLDAGYVTTRAYLPQQNLSTGILTVNVIEGVIESFDQSSAPSIHLHSAFPHLKGRVLNLRDIEQGIEQLNRLAGNNVRMELIPGQSVGSTVVKLINDQQRPWQANLRYDNSGQAATGERQLRTYLSVDNPLGVNDFFFLSAQTDTKDQRDGQQSESVSLRYEIPYGYWLYALDANWFEYLNRVQGQLQSFDSTGQSHRQSITASRVVSRGQASKTEVVTSLTRKKNKNYIEDVFLETSSRTLAIGSLELKQNYFLPSNQTIQASLTYQRGLSLFGSPEAESSDEPQSEYTAWLLNVSYDRAFRGLNKTWRYNTRLYGQYSDDVLFGSEKISVGSQYSVRGFKEESLSSRTGGYWRNELSVSLPQTKNIFGIYSINPYLGVDVGSTKGESRLSRDETISGAAIGFRVGGKFISTDFSYEKALKRPDGFTASSEQFNFSITAKL